MAAPERNGATSWSRSQELTRLILGALTAVLLSPQQSPAAGSVVIPADAQPLINTLKAHGFRVLFAPPPVQGAYGLFQATTKTLWIHPLSFELGIGLQTLVHEAVHAAQSCPTGILTPVGWKLQVAAVVHLESQGLVFRNYPAGRRHLEQEAFAMQGQPNAVKAIAKAIQQRCVRTPPASPGR